MEPESENMYYRIVDLMDSKDEGLVTDEGFRDRLQDLLDEFVEDNIVTVEREVSLLRYDIEKLEEQVQDLEYDKECLEDDKIELRDKVSSLRLERVELVRRMKDLEYRLTSLGQDV